MFLNKLSKHITTNALKGMNIFKKTMSINLNGYKQYTSTISYNKMSNKRFFSNTKEKEETEKSQEEEREEKTEKTKEETKTKEKGYALELRDQLNESEKKLEQTRKKFDDLRKAFLDNVQETEAIKVRYDREINLTKEYAITKFAKDMLDVADNFHRAMDSVGTEQDFKELSEEDKLNTFKNFLEGITITQKSLKHILKKHGVIEYSPLKEKFDPHKHEAVFDYADDDAEAVPGTVGQVLQTGFKIGDRVLRPAKVGVLKKK